MHVLSISSSYTYLRQSQEDCSLVTLLRKMLEFYWRGKKQSTACHITEELQGGRTGKEQGQHPEANSNLYKLGKNDF